MTFNNGSHNVILPQNPVLPVGIDTGLDLARERVPVGDQSGEDRAEVGVVGNDVEGIATVVVVVERIEGFGAELDAEAFGDLRVFNRA